MQLADISQYGNVLDVAKLLTPPGAKIMFLNKIVVEQPERDTGTIRGKVKAAPQTIYRYEYGPKYTVFSVHFLQLCQPGFIPLIAIAGLTMCWAQVFMWQQLPSLEPARCCWLAGLPQAPNGTLSLKYCGS